MIVITLADAHIPILSLPATYFDIYPKDIISKAPINIAYAWHFYIHVTPFVTIQRQRSKGYYWILQAVIVGGILRVLIVGLGVMFHVVVEQLIEG